MFCSNKESAEIQTKIKTISEAVVASLKLQQDALSTQIAKIKTQLDARAGELPYMREHLGEFEAKLETAKVAWDNARHENAMKANPDKWKALKASSDSWAQFNARKKISRTRTNTSAVG